MSKKESFIVKEMKELFAIAFVFYIIFLMFSILKMALLGQQHINGFKMGAAVIGALIIAKVVLIFDHFRVSKKLENYPKVITVFFKSGIYLIGFALFTILEHFIKGLIEDLTAAEAIKHAIYYLGSLDFVLTVAIVYISFLTFSTFWVIRNEYGPKSLYLLFFKRKKKND